MAVEVQFQHYLTDQIIHFTVYFVAYFKAEITRSVLHNGQ